MSDTITHIYKTRTETTTLHGTNHFLSLYIECIFFVCSSTFLSFLRKKTFTHIFFPFLLCCRFVCTQHCLPCLRAVDLYRKYLYYRHIHSLQLKQADPNLNMIYHAYIHIHIYTCLLRFTCLPALPSISKTVPHLYLT